MTSAPAEHSPVLALRESLAQQPGLHRLLSIKEVCAVVPLSARQIDRLVRQGLFPAPFFISANRRAWPEPKIRDFLRERELRGQCRRTYSTRDDSGAGKGPTAAKSVEI